MTAFSKNWLSIFGAPKRLFSDNEEFISDEFYNMLDKIRDDVKCHYDVALAWAVSVKNVLVNQNGFISVQLVFGKASNLPSTINSHLPAFESTIRSVDLAHHTSAIHAVREAFITSEASQKIKLALKKNVRYYQRFYEPGDYVYYKRDSSSQWKGLAKVLGQDGPALFLRHGARYIKVHMCRVQSISTLRSEHSETKDKQVEAVNSQNNTENNIVNEIKPSSDEEDDNKKDLQMHDTAIGNRKKHPYPTVVITPNQIIKFKDSNDIECIRRIISRARKATGKYKSCYNIEYQSPLALNGTKT